MGSCSDINPFVSSWLHQGKIFCHGGLTTPPDQLVYYNIAENSWEWTTTDGDIPPTRVCALTITTKSTVVVFGGSDHENLDANNENTPLNDLHIMDKDTLRWKKVHGSLECEGVPHFDPLFTLTRMSESTGLIVGDGGFCWLLDLDKAKRLMDPTTIWTKVPINFQPLCHVAVMEPIGRKVWVMGGQRRSDPQLQQQFQQAMQQMQQAMQHMQQAIQIQQQAMQIQQQMLQQMQPQMQPQMQQAMQPAMQQMPQMSLVISDILHIKFNQVASLKESAIHHIVRGICAADPRLTGEKLPRHLRQEIEEQRSEISERSSCMEDKKCIACLIASE